jgi:uncharacterized membrane protein
MPKYKKARFAAFLFAVLIVIFGWASFSMFTKDFSVTSFWGAGIAFSIGLLFIYILLGRSFGYTRSFLATLGILLVITFALVLNGARAWPFGPAHYHGILGWKFYKVAWPLPIFWSVVIMGSMMLRKPKEITGDPKVLFSWAFDTALMTMILALVIEPIVKSANITTWIVPGAILGVPLSAFLGWFITSFIAAIVAMLILKPWDNLKCEIHRLVPLFFAAFFALTFIFATKISLTLIQLLSAIYIIVFLIWTLRLSKNQNSAITVIESTTVEITQSE